MQTYGQTKNIVTAKRELLTKELLLHTFDLNQPVLSTYGTDVTPTGEFGEVFNTIPEDHKIQYNTGDYEMVIYSEQGPTGRRMDTVQVMFQNTVFYKQTLRHFVPTDFQFMVYVMREMLNESIRDTNKGLQEQNQYQELSYHPIRVRVFELGAPPQPFTSRGVPKEILLPHFADCLQEYMTVNDCSYLDHRVYKSNHTIQSDKTYTIVAMFHPRPKHLTGMTYADLFFDTLDRMDARDEEHAKRDETWGTNTKFAQYTEGIARSGIHYLIQNMGRSGEIIQEYTTMRELSENTEKILNMMREFPNIGFVVEHAEQPRDQKTIVARLHGRMLDRIESDFSRMFQTTVIK